MCGGGDFNVDAYARMLPGFALWAEDFLPADCRVCGVAWWEYIQHSQT